MVEDPIVYSDRPDRRVLDLRKLGVDSVPAVGLTRLKSVVRAPDQHIHPGCIEIVLCVKGILAFEAGPERYDFLPGSVFVSTDRQPHALTDNPKGLTTYSLLFKVPRAGESTLGLTRQESQWLTQSLGHLPQRRFRDSSEIKKCFERIFAIYDSTGEILGKRLELKATVLELLTAVIKSAHTGNYVVKPRIATIIQRIVQHPEDDYRLDALAMEAGLAQTSFSIVFKQATGLPPHAFLLNERIRRACDLLTKTDKPIQVISDALRFSSPQHFTTTFRDTIGMTPICYRQQSKHDTESNPRLILPCPTKEVLLGKRG